MSKDLVPLNDPDCIRHLTTNTAVYPSPLTAFYDRNAKELLYYYNGKFKAACKLFANKRVIIFKRSERTHFTIWADTPLHREAIIIELKYLGISFTFEKRKPDGYHVRGEDYYNLTMSTPTDYAMFMFYFADIIP